jgi:hypothetical protein
VKIEIKTNVYFIPERLREIDGGYFVVRDLDRAVFEIHNRNQPDTTFCLTVPYDGLDERTVTLTLKTRIANIEKIIRETEDENEKIKKSRLAVDMDKAAWATKEVLDYANRHSLIETPDSEAFSTRFI